MNEVTIQDIEAGRKEMPVEYKDGLAASDPLSAVPATVTLRAISARELARITHAEKAGSDTWFDILVASLPQGFDEAWLNRVTPPTVTSLGSAAMALAAGKRQKKDEAAQDAATAPSAGSTATAPNSPS